ncbi:MAG: hypothetical protein WAZ77_04140 [Candidatus Nitrosopolaris sp.]|jgi:hypothetical protein
MVVVRDVMPSIVLGIAILMMVIGATAEANAQVNGTSPLSNALLKGLGVGGKQCAFHSAFGKSAILGPLGVQYRNNTSGCTIDVLYASLME